MSASVRLVGPSPPARRRHPLFALAGLRPAYAAHTSAEDALLRQLVEHCRTIVELGVAEGGSALALRESMPGDAILWLVDPFFPGRLPIAVNQVLAHRLVRGAGNGSVRWLKALSWDAGASWKGPPVEFLFIDADHSRAAVERDWSSWEPNLSPAALIAFHDTRTFQGGWTKETDGPVTLVNDHFRGQSERWRIVAEVDSIVVVGAGQANSA
jgi:predicted O-methyltransferase YrrM